MPKHKTGFDNDRLIDERFSKWISKCRTTSDNVYCNLCKKSFSIMNGGTYQALQHQKGDRHKSLEQSLQQQSRMRSDFGTVSIDSSRVIVISTEEQTARAEILQLLRLVKHDQSFSSCDDLVATLRASFNDPVAHAVTLGSTKVSYSFSYGLGPYYHDLLINDIKNAWNSMIVDETSTERNTKQFDIHLRYWSPTKDRIVHQYMTTSFLGYARADDLTESFTSACRRTVCR